MAEKKREWYSVAMIAYWAIYLAATMALFEKTGVVPYNIPFGVVGWTVIVELPRVIIGYGLSLLIFKKQN